jgi:hypothetical protein
MSELIEEVPKPLYAVRARLLECYKFCSDERVRIAESKRGNAWNIFGPDEETERRDREIEEEDTKLWAKMEAYRDAVAIIDNELTNLVKEHLVLQW